MSKEEENQFGLVYDGAITENEIGKVNIHSVNYMLNGLKISANVYTPANFNETNQYPTVVVAHPNRRSKRTSCRAIFTKTSRIRIYSNGF